MQRAAEQLTEQLHLIARGGPGGDGTRIGREEATRAAAELAARFDPRWGGFGSAPKFPTVPWLLFLLRYAERHGGDGARA